MASAGRIAALSERIMNIQHTLKNETHTKRESLQRALRAVEEKFQNGSDNAHKKFALLKEQVSIDKKQLSRLQGGLEEEREARKGLDEKLADDLERLEGRLRVLMVEEAKTRRESEDRLFRYI